MSSEPDVAYLILGAREIELDNMLLDTWKARSKAQRIRGAAGARPEMCENPEALQRDMDRLDAALASVETLLEQLLERS
jgi:hypothetical protein